MTKIITTLDFIKMAKNIHGKLYEYLLVNYISTRETVKIICKKHGMFKQTPNAHLRGNGCPKCGIDAIAKSRLSNTKVFIEKAKKQHRNKYDYSKAIYFHSGKKLKIICHKHGPFQQAPSNHLYGQGCPKCSHENQLKLITSSTEEFIKKANKTHNNKYNYSLVNYINAKSKIKIICEVHGIFKQTPNGHLSGKGCSSCGGQIKNVLKRKELWIEKSNKIHGFKYDYSKVVHKNNHTKVIISCSKHGIFKQLPQNHIKKIYSSGCPICTSSLIENKVRSFLFNKHIPFVMQKTFKNCINPKTNYKLKYDFYIERNKRKN